MIPCKVYYPRADKDSRPQEPKVLTANNADELESLLRIGWKLEEKDPAR